MPSGTRGLIRYSVFQGLDEPTLFHLSQWHDESARDEYVHSVSAGPRSAVDAELPGIHRDWREMATPYRSFVRGPKEAHVRCLVVVRQPIIRPDAALARDWIDTVFRALESEAGPPEGLCAASFFISLDGDVAINLAEWVSPDAHRAALKPVDFGRNGSIGDSLEWRAARSHSGVTSEHEVGRYELVGTVERESSGHE
jgi:hypothetical protein